MWTGSLAVLSDALQSGLDLVSTLLTLFTVRVSDKPPDEDHPFGHGKTENISALVQAGLLLLTCGWIIYEAAERLFVRPVEVDPSVWAFGVALVSIVVDISRSRALARAAKKHHSQAMEADALNFQADIWASAVVLAGLLMVWASERYGLSPAFLKADAGAAVVVALMVARLSVKLGRNAVDALLDRAPAELVRRVRRAVEGVEGVLSSQRVRVRPVGNEMFIDVEVSADRTLPFEETHAIASNIEVRVQEVIPGADVVVHTVPMARADESLVERVFDAALDSGFGVHNVFVHRGKDHLYVDLDLEVERSLTLSEAHAEADRLERELRNRMPQVHRINVHIEPRHMDVMEDRDVTWGADGVVDLVRRTAMDVPGMKECHDILVRKSGRSLFVSIHCLFDGRLLMGEVHESITSYEHRLKREIPDLERVLIHTEPAEDHAPAEEP
jgi:cation diffusion facilitator family transporter